MYIKNRNIAIASTLAQKNDIHVKGEKGVANSNFAGGSAFEIFVRLYLAPNSTQIGANRSYKGSKDFQYHGMKISSKINSAELSDIDNPNTDYTVYGLMLKQDINNDTVLNTAVVVPTAELYKFLQSINQVRIKNDGRGGKKISIQSWNSAKRINAMFDFLEQYETLEQFKANH